MKQIYSKFIKRGLLTIIKAEINHNHILSETLCQNSSQDHIILFAITN